MVTNDDALARRIRLFVNKAWGYGEAKPDHYFLALNSRMSELQGAVGRRSSASSRECRRPSSMAAHLDGMLTGLPGVEIPPLAFGDEHTYWRYPCSSTPRTFPKAPTTSPAPCARTASRLRPATSRSPRSRAQSSPTSGRSATAGSRSRSHAAKPSTTRRNGSPERTSTSHGARAAVERAPRRSARRSNRRAHRRDRGATRPELAHERKPALRAHRRRGDRAVVHPGVRRLRAGERRRGRRPGDRAGRSGSQSPDRDGHIVRGVRFASRADRGGAVRRRRRVHTACVPRRCRARSRRPRHRGVVREAADARPAVGGQARRRRRRRRRAPHDGRQVPLRRRRDPGQGDRGVGQHRRAGARSRTSSRPGSRWPEGGTPIRPSAAAAC